MAALWLLALLPTAANAAMPEGPRLAVAALSFRPPTASVFDMDALGGTEETLFAHDLRSFPTLDPSSAPAWSPDGSRIAFTAAVGVKRTRFSSGSKTKIFVVPADGGQPQPMAGTTNGVDPVFSPDGRTIAFAVERRRLRANGHGGGNVVYASESVWLAGVDGGGRIQLTPWRNGLYESPSSFSPDGTGLAVTRRIGSKPSEAVAIALADGGTTVLSKEALEPVYSPNGAEIAYLEGGPHTVSTPRGHTTATLTDLFVMRADGSGSRRLTDTPKKIELAPSWDPSGSRLAFTRLGDPFTDAGILGLGSSVMEINVDGSCPTKVLAAAQTIYFGVSWRPGPGRAAGPIAC